MEWIDRLNRSIDYIEGHMAHEIDYGELAKVACCSTYHYQRMFSYMAGIPLSEYIRRRRMSLAAADLQKGDERILDIGLKYGYTSPTAFTRAFQGIHGVSPSNVRKGGISLKAYLPIRFKITVQGVEEMNYRIEEKSAFRIVGICSPLHKKIEENFAIVPQMWQTAAMDGTIAQLASLMDGEPRGLLGVSACNAEDEWKYYIAVSTSMQAGDDMDEYIVPASTWAIFPGTGTNQSIQELEKRIVSEWLPTSGYEYANAPDVEVYLNPDPNDAQYEVWIPVRRI